MQDNTKWIRERLESMLGRAESYYRSVGFKRTAFHMHKTLQAVKANGVASPEFYPGYASKLKEDSAELMRKIGFDNLTTQVFIDSIKASIDSLTSILDKLNRSGRVSLYEPSTSKAEDRAGMDRFIAENGLFDPGHKDVSPAEAVDLVRPFADAVMKYVYSPSVDYVKTQIGVAFSMPEIQEPLESLFSARGVIEKDGEKISDFRYVYTVPEALDDSKDVFVSANGSAPLMEVARWPLLMYYKVPILTSMIAVHNVVFLSFLDSAVSEQLSKLAEGKH